MTVVDAPARIAQSVATRVVAVVLVVTGAVGWVAALALTIDKLTSLANKDAVLECNISVLVQCSKNLGSAQGAILGFPNPLLGLGGFVAPIAVGVAILAGATFARWFWIALNVGVAAALGFCIWLMYQSIFALGSLCPWCMLVWAMVIPMFFTLTLHTMRSGHWGERARPVGQTLLTWVPALTIAFYLLVAVVAQLRLDVLAEFTR